MQSAATWLSRRVRELGFLRRYPHFLPLLARLVAVDDPSCGLMAVSHVPGGPLRLHLNTAALEQVGRGFCGVLQHELHHVLLGHVTDPAYRRAAHPSILQVAKELAANEGIVEPLPGEPIRLADYTQLGIRAGQTTWERYDLLVAAWKEGRWQPPAVAVRCCAGGEQHDGEARLREMLRGLRRPRRLPVSRACPESLDWRIQLRRFASSRPERRQSLRRPSRRDPTRARLGELPGWSLRPGRPTLLVALDTSSSMAADLFPRIAGELGAIARRAHVIVVECDDAVRREYRYGGELVGVEGRGSTDLRPVFAPDVLARHRPDGIVYFTDGEGPFPAASPGVSTLWVLTGDLPFACPWGAQVRMFAAAAAL